MPVPPFRTRARNRPVTGGVYMIPIQCYLHAPTKATLLSSGTPLTAPMVLAAAAGGGRGGEGGM